MSLTTKRQMSSYGAELRTSENNEHDLPSSDAGSPDLTSAKPLRYPSSSASDRSPKRIKRHQDPRTPTTCAAKALKPITTSKEHRVPLVDLGSNPLTQKNPRQQEVHMPKIDRYGALAAENDPAPPKLGSDEESFGGGDIFTSTDQQQFSALRSKMQRHDYEESTTEF